MDEILCPGCGKPLEVDCEWEFMEEDGDYIVCGFTVECECGREVCIKGYYRWDGVYGVD